ncbi:MAG: hypothetical protein NTW49_08860 [Bacteroidia bacterium]|nr:hypothetical protein [Bacteroidia bacterium]
MERIKCLTKKCHYYREIDYNEDKRLGYKHKCLMGYFNIVNEGETYPSYASEEDGLIIYRDDHLSNYWSKRKYCRKDWDSFYSKLLPNIFAGLAIIISLLVLFSEYNKKRAEKKDTFLSIKQKQEVESIIVAKLMQLTVVNTEQLKKTDLIIELFRLDSVTSIGIKNRKIPPITSMHQP